MRLICGKKKSGSGIGSFDRNNAITVVVKQLLLRVLKNLSNDEVSLVSAWRPHYCSVFTLEYFINNYELLRTGPNEFIWVTNDFNYLEFSSSFLVFLKMYAESMFNSPHHYFWFSQILHPFSPLFFKIFLSSKRVYFFQHHLVTTFLEYLEFFFFYIFLSYFECRL